MQLRFSGRFIVTQAMPVLELDQHGLAAGEGRSLFTAAPASVSILLLHTAFANAQNRIPLAAVHYRGDVPRVSQGEKRMANLELIAEQIADPDEPWSLGTFGAIAEFMRDANKPAEIEPSRSGDVGGDAARRHPDRCPPGSAGSRFRDDHDPCVEPACRAVPAGARAPMNRRAVPDRAGCRIAGRCVRRTAARCVRSGTRRACRSIVASVPPIRR